jgi:DNA repair protein SbcD/Mre11
MKILHAADLHLDSPMRGLLAYEDAPVEELRMATRTALGNLVDAAIAEEVALVLLAGDIFDGDWPHYGTGLHFVKEMGRLREAGIPVVMVSGNHDAASKLTRPLPLPDNVTLLDARTPQTLIFEELGIAVHGQSYATPELREDLAATYPAPIGDMFNIGLLHTAAGGRPGHENYAPCSVEALTGRGYDFWALGHVHAREILGLDPLILFPGNLQGRNIRETGPKGATLVEVDHSRPLVERHIDLDCVRWELLRVDAAGISGTDELFALLAARVREASEAAGERLLATGVVFEGVSAVHGALAANPERLRYQAISAAVGAVGDQVFIERVRLQTEAPRTIAIGGEDAVGELIREIEELSGTTGLAIPLKALAPLSGILPEAAKEGFDPADAEQVRALLGELRDSLPTRLLQGAGG